MIHSRLAMTLGEAIFTQRSIRRFRPDPVPIADLELIVAAASKAPSGGNSQIARFLAVNDPGLIREFGALYREAWWAKRRDAEGWTGPDDLNAAERAQWAPSMRLADEMGGVPCVVFALSVPPNAEGSVLPATQNLMLAARALGIGSVPTTLHSSVEGRFREMFGIPPEVKFHFAIPLGYPAGNFGPTKRRPTWETSYLNRWEGTVPWAPGEAADGPAS
ncbi:nitroreductase family protein [Pseudonocardia xinjiangensis]|uniref:Nitroreductase n=1 Tax=Pseudonocardia xinjiangensis TaxID=75289 RepID=A0ABX1RKW0_9PSEU|nr:nitroreductase family protein [Pseudonocardia xinjiangensis]NMH79826.1 nitroreductase [Pseudonocardia xinjiangensis]